MTVTTSAEIAQTAAQIAMTVKKVFSSTADALEAADRCLERLVTAVALHLALKLLLIAR